jgi:CubicO group peptidase (beta-lactamase class C family)
MSKFMSAYLNEGETILHPATVSIMNDSLGRLSTPGDSLRGLGWEAHLTTDGRRYLTHSGGGPGFATIFRVYPEENLGVVVMGNDSSIDRQILAEALANMDW